MDDVDDSTFFDCREDMIAFYDSMLMSQQQPRDDDKELLELVIIYLGGTPKRGVRFLAPGPTHRARWMAKAIYAIKLLLFHHQFKLTSREQRAVKRICTFVVTAYVKAWFQAPVAVSAPNNDLLLLKALHAFKAQDPEVGNAAITKFSNHLWYLSEELISLAFFDDHVPVETKRHMVLALRNNKGNNREYKANIEIRDLAVKYETLDKFVTTNSYKFFHQLGIKAESFLNKDPDQWMTDSEYIKGQETCSMIRVVNDAAERGVALMEEFNKLHICDEEQKQYLLLVVKENRKKYPNANKSTIMNAVVAISDSD